MASEFYVKSIFNTKCIKSEHQRDFVKPFQKFQTNISYVNSTTKQVPSGVQCPLVATFVNTTWWEFWEVNSQVGGATSLEPTPQCFVITW